MTHSGETMPDAGVFALHVTSNNYIYGKNSLIGDAIRYAGLSASDQREISIHLIHFLIHLLIVMKGIKNDRVIFQIQFELMHYSLQRI